MARPFPFRPLLLAAATTLTLGACTWVPMEPQGATVRVARFGEDLSYCARRGDVTVSVRERVGFYERNPLKVRDELEVLARNEAPRLGADTLQPLEEPVEGEQRFVAMSCRGATRVVETIEPVRHADEVVETFPLRGD
jgi:hypothetical protein